MARLSLYLLGSFQALLDGGPITGFESDKVRALLAFLAVEADLPHRRQSLAGMFWSAWPEAGARRNLSRALAKLERDGVIRNRKRCIELLDKERLARSSCK